MLPASTTKAHHKARKPSPDVIFNGNINNIKYAIEKFNHARLLFKEVFYFFIFSVIRFKLLISAGIQYSPAIKNKSTAIAGDIFRNSFFIAEAIYLDNKWRFIIGF